MAAIQAKANSNAPWTPEHIKTVSDLFAEYKVAREPKMRAWRDVQSAWDVWAKEFVVLASHRHIHPSLARIA